MPRVRVSSSQNCHEKEGRLLLAVQAIKKKEITLICEAAHHFNVPESILCTRLRGTTNRAESRANGHKLTEIEEEVLKQILPDNIYNFDKTGFAIGLCAHQKVITKLLQLSQSVLLDRILKRSYASLVDQKMWLGISYINKLDFLAAYPQARISIFKLDTIRNSCQIAMQKVILLEQENRIAHDNGLSVQEATELEEAYNVSFQAIPGPCGPPAEGAQTPKAWALPIYSVVVD
ncbi:hypothetical protein AN9046.2 [Aspergillus nidulans FGSC A4]|uniref:HTH psq-type domain-containing protein n=1 Tax=Emericella nidulans (strain FGSC A4 / ATCC 38163 / CBS 112.46 / NRRL 194 / M139) TaxID=227321 RepID=Q5ARN4_EMENI|nr:hypothetical protein [Aspergillus nidulans FGSC A4]EAA64378.1 hypothetical protein AN9046.2 [Aspergillus nidulans FGSC A4]CBF84396.1 TPA: hypothetical protein ANIA_09046 [Aspergillus nidulans FGSC A4]|eukprot:XP_682315.1 hypothetical protein AN9046.2 [Aspergillus nidulans FGSC A4]